MVFKDTEIYKYLSARNPTLLVMVDTVYTQCEIIMSRIPSVFPDYTQHDIKHCIRVIEYMSQLLKGQFSNFSDLHIAMLIFVGLTHDVGMYSSEVEVRKLKTNLKRRKYKPLDEDFAVKEEIRSKHGDRILEVMNSITELHDAFKLPNTAYSVLEDVAKIGSSHCKEYSWIASKLKDKTSVAQYEYSPMQLAILLRIGDALDIDDQRAPETLYGMASEFYCVNCAEWAQHYVITNYNKIRVDASNQLSLYFSGSSDNPAIYRKVVSYIKWLRNDIRSINAEFFLGDKALLTGKYYLNVSPEIEVSIEKIGFSDAELRFELDYSKITRLLMGENLYGNKKHGLRELLQNAVDAVLIRNEIAKSAKQLYNPDIRIEICKSEKQVLIKDNGIGMTEDIIHRYFFNIGNSFYRSKDFEGQNYDYEPIGKFGIGFLACFMLSSDVCLTTSPLSGSKVFSILFDKNSSYVTFIEDDKAKHIGSEGTTISLDFDQFFNVFKTVDEVQEYVNQYFLSDKVRIRVISETEFIPSNVIEDMPEHTFLRDSSSGVDASIKLESYASFIYGPQDLVPDSYVYIIDDDIDEPSIFLGEGRDSELGNAITEFLYACQDRNYIEFFESLQSELYDFDQFSFDSEMLTSEFLSVLHCLFILGYSNDQNIDWYDYLNIKALEDSYKDGRILWNELLYIENKHIPAFYEYKTSHNIAESIRHFRDNNIDVRWIPFFPYNKIKHLRELFVDQYGWDNYYRPIIRKVEKPAWCSKNHLLYLPLLKDQVITFCEVYYKGVFVDKCRIVLPCIDAGTKISSLKINIYSKNIELNVSRSSISDEGMDTLTSVLGRMVYKHILEKDLHLDRDERALLEEFIEEYY